MKQCVDSGVTKNSSVLSDDTRSNIKERVQEYTRKHAKLYALVEKTVSPLRMEHSVCVATRSIELALAHDEVAVACEHAWIAGIAHDICREHSGEQLLLLAEQSGFAIELYEQEHPLFLHGKAAVAVLQQEYPLEQYITPVHSYATMQECVQNIYFAIAHHTLGWKMPNDLLLLLFIADATSKDRGMNELFLHTLSALSVAKQCVVLIDFLSEKYNTTHPTTRDMYTYCTALVQD